MTTRSRKYTQKYKKRQNKTQKNKYNKDDKFYIAYITIPVNKNRKNQNKHVISQRLYKLFCSMKKSQVVCVKYNDKNIYKILNRCHACVLPPENLFNMDSCDESNTLDFYNHCFELYKYIKERNEKLGRFPTLCICRSFQNIILFEKYGRKLVSQKRLLPCGDKKDEFHSVKLVNKKFLINFEIPPERSIIFKDMGKQKLNLLTKENGIPHNNNYGFYLHELKNRSWFTDNFKAITYSIDKLNYKVINTIEHKKYPIFGIQCHPEYSKRTRFVYDFFEEQLNLSLRVDCSTPPETNYKYKIKDNYLIFS